MSTGHQQQDQAYERNTKSMTLSEIDPGTSAGTVSGLQQMTYEDTTKLEATEARLNAISELMSIFSSKLYEQDQVTQEVVRLANQSVSNIKEANRQLLEANKYNESYGKWWSIFFFSLAIILLVLDFLN